MAGRWASRAAAIGALIAGALCAGCEAKGQAPTALHPAIATDAVTVDADDPAIWVNPADPAHSLILGTNKVAAPQGALVVFDLTGRTRQTVNGIDRPNNVDVEYGLPLGGRVVDVAVITERLQHRLRVFTIAAQDTPLTDVSGPSGIPVLTGTTGQAAEPMGIALYKRPRDGALFAIVAPRIGDDGGYLWQYRLQDNGAGQVVGTFVRRFGRFSGSATGTENDNQIEAVVVDDASGFVYFAEEDFGIRKAYADPDHPDADQELAVFGRNGFRGDREGLAVYARPDGTGFLVASDQLPDGTVFHVFPREGARGNPHDHAEIATLASTADSSDGIEATAAAVGPAFPKGVLIAMNSRARNFLLFDWAAVEKAAPALLP